MNKKSKKEANVYPLKVDIGDFALEIAESSEKVLEGEICNYEAQTKSWLKDKTKVAFDILMKKYPDAMNIVASFPKKAKEIFALDEDFLKEMLDKGYEIKKFKDDPTRFDAMFRDANNVIKKHAKLKKMELPASNPADFTQALTMAAMARQIENLSIAVENVAESVNTVLVGQWDDRLALTDGAKRILWTALNCENEKMRQDLLSTAIAQNSIAQSQIHRSLKSELEMCKDFKKRKNAECQKILSQVYAHTQGYFDACRTQCVLLNEAQEFKALAVTTEQIKSEIVTLFPKETLLLLNSQTDKKDDLNFWSKTVGSNIEKIEGKLENIGKNAKLQLENKRIMEIGNG